MYLCLKVRSDTANIKKNRNVRLMRRTKLTTNTVRSHNVSPKAKRKMAVDENAEFSSRIEGISIMLMSVEFAKVAVASHNRQKAGTMERVTLSATPMYRYSHVSGIASTLSMMADDMSSTDISAFFVWRRSQIVQLTRKTFMCKLYVTNYEFLIRWNCPNA